MLKWRRGTLMLSWLAYWASIIIIKLGDGLLAAFDATRPDVKGEIAINGANNGLSAIITQAGVETWAGSASFLAIAFWIAGPPLLLWLVWLIGTGRNRRGPGGAAEIAALPDAGLPESPVRSRSRETVPSEGRTDA